MYDKSSPYYIDFPGRIKAIQKGMAEEKLDLYLGSRLRTMSWTTDAFFPWRSFIVIPADGLPTAFTFVIDAARAADDSWLDEDHVLGFAPMGGQDQITQISDLISSLAQDPIVRSVAVNVASTTEENAAVGNVWDAELEFSLILTLQADEEEAEG